MANPEGPRYYSVILAAKWIAPSLFQPKKDKLDSNAKPIVAKANGQTIQENNRATKTLGETGTVYRIVTNKWVSTKDALDELPPMERKACNDIKAWLAAKPAMVWFHCRDDSQDICPHENHLHVICKDQKDANELFTVTPSKTFSFKKVKVSMNKADGLYTLQQIFVMPGFLHYLSQLPRIFLGANRKDLLSLYYHEYWKKVLAGEDVEQFTKDYKAPETVQCLPEEAADTGDDDLDDICGYKRPAPSDTDMFGMPAGGSSSKVQKTGDLDFCEEQFDAPVCKSAPGGKGTNNAMYDNGYRQGKRKGKTNYEKLIYCVNTMKEANLRSYQEVQEFAFDSCNDLEFTQIVFSYNGDKMVTKALDLCNLEGFNDIPFGEWYNLSPTGDMWMDQYTLFLDWCNEQSIDPVRLVTFVHGAKQGA